MFCGFVSPRVRSPDLLTADGNEMKALPSMPWQLWPCSNFVPRKLRLLAT